MLDEYLAVGEIVRPQGIRGELKGKTLAHRPRLPRAAIST